MQASERVYYEVHSTTLSVADDWVEGKNTQARLVTPEMSRRTAVAWFRPLRHHTHYVDKALVSTRHNLISEATPACKIVAILGPCLLGRGVKGTDVLVTTGCRYGVNQPLDPAPEPRR